MIVIVLVCIATTALFVVLAVELGKLMLGADREGVAVERLLHGVAGTVKVATGRFGAAETPGRTEDQIWVRHDLEVEQQVRDRLYGARRLRGRGD